MNVIRITQLFPFWAIVFSLLAWVQLSLFIPFKSWIVPLLAVVMFGMGLSLHVSDFKRAMSMPRLIISGVALQYSVMPVGALLISMALNLDPVITTGMVLVGASPGGTASNVICYLARGNVALSISLTAVSTLLAIVFTPLLAWLLIDSSIHVPAGQMLLSLINIVILPVGIGVMLNHFAGRRLAPVSHVFPLISVTAIVLIIAIIVGLNQNNLSQAGVTLLLAVILHNGIGLICGFYASRLLGYQPSECRTLAIEVGMQNSGLAVALAIKHFTATAALPGAIFSIWHNLSGSILAAFWSKRQN
ncbi:MAG: bile acid:sodium symporter family protein [Gammaproteobacteria bacterium]|nr:bile acid:sodium symporter family protein [Gammaproteobacteria bacterium]